MVVAITDQTGQNKIEVPRDESGFYEAIAKKVASLPYPNDITVTIADRFIHYKTSERGGTCNIQEVSNNIRFKQHSVFAKKYLTYADFISAEKKAKLERGEVKYGGDYGSYKFYSLESEDEETIKATWGSMRGIGMPRSCTYPVSMFWIKYYEKIAKGYVDNSEAYLGDAKLKQDKPKPVSSVKDKTDQTDRPAKPVNKLSQRLYDILSKAATKVVNAAFGFGGNVGIYDNKRITHNIEITPGMVNKSKEYLDQLYKTTDLDSFNHILLQLCMVCPRKTWDMKTLMASTEADIPKVLQREEDLVDAMEGVLLNKKPEPKKTQKPLSGISEDPFDDIGIQIEEPTLKEQKTVMDMLTPDLKNKVKTIYKVTNKVHDKRFSDYCKKNDIKDTKLLWHGSRNENWLSIMGKGLLLKPNAVITGKMFGNGIYFAPKASKSWGYTSYSGSYWARGSSNLAFMGVYETAYGNPYNPRSGENWQYTADFLKKKSKNCVHAHGGDCGLRNDEIIFYDEAAMVLRFVVQFQ